MYAEPSWLRLRLAKPPDHNSGLGVGIIIIDDISPHPALRHLAKHLKHVVVADDFSVTCCDIADENFNPSILDRGMQGLMTCNR